MQQSTAEASALRRARQTVMAPANIFLALLDSASIAHDVAKLEALKARSRKPKARDAIDDEAGGT